MLFVSGAQQSDLILYVRVFVHAKLLQSDSLYPMDCSPPGSSDHGDSSDKNTRVGCHALLQGSSQPRDRTSLMFPALAGRFFTTSSTWYILFFIFFSTMIYCRILDHQVKNLPAMRETWDQSLGWKDPLEKGKATHSSILAWRFPWTV